MAEVIAYKIKPAQAQAIIGTSYITRLRPGNGDMMHMEVRPVNDADAKGIARVSMATFFEAFGDDGQGLRERAGGGNPDTMNNLFGVKGLFTGCGGGRGGCDLDNPEFVYNMEMMRNLARGINPAVGEAREP